MEQSFNELAADVGYLLQVLSSQSILVGRLLPEELVNQERIEIAGKFLSSGSDQSLTCPIQRLGMGHSSRWIWYDIIW